MIKGWILSMLAKLLPKLAEAIAKKVFTPASALARREKDRVRWHGYRERCKTTGTEIDNILADWLGTYMKFRTPPGAESMETRAKRCIAEAWTHIAFVKMWVGQERPPIDQVGEINDRIKKLSDICRDAIRILDGNHADDPNG